MNYYKVKDNPGWVRDPRSKAIINNNDESFKEYKNKKLLHTKVNELSTEFKEIKQSINEIKQMILMLNTKNCQEKNG